jgi:hypothetical protein
VAHSARGIRRGVKEYKRLRGELQIALEASSLPETPRGAEALHALLVRLRLGRV